MSGEGLRSQGKEFLEGGDLGRGEGKNYKCRFKCRFFVLVEKIVYLSM